MSACEHGSLKRSCEMCERDEKISALESSNALLREALEEAHEDLSAINEYLEYCHEASARAQSMTALEKLTKVLAPPSAAPKDEAKEKANG